MELRLVLTMFHMWTGIILILSCSHGRVEAVHGGVPHTSPAAAAVVRIGEFCCSGTILSETAVITDGRKVCGNVKEDELSVVAGENILVNEASHDWNTKQLILREGLKKSGIFHTRSDPTHSTRNLHFFLVLK